MKKQEKRLLFCGNDARQTALYDIFKQKYENSEITDFENADDFQKAAECDILILPTVATKDGININGTKAAVCDIIDKTQNCKCIITGIIPQSLKHRANRRGIVVREYTADEGFKTLNAVPTAEGALALAIESSDKTLWRSQCLIIGCGSIGKRLAANLSALGAYVTVTARKEKDKAYIGSCGYEFAQTESVDEIAKSFDFIFNTVPVRYLKTETLNLLCESSVYLELASAPFGIDFTAAENAKCKIVNGGGLPSRFSAITAAEIAAGVIEKITDEVFDI